MLAHHTYSAVRSRLGLLTALLLALTTVLGPTASSAVPPPDGPEPTVTAGQQAAATEVTLITGHRVLVREVDGRSVATVAPGQDTRTGAILSYRTGGGLYVVPAAVADLVGGLLDRELFNVTKLARSGYGDTATDAVPVIIRPAGADAATWSPPSPMRVERRLESIDAVAATIPKARTSSIGETLAAIQARRSGEASAAPTGPLLVGVGRIWLDRRVYASQLDRNLRQVSAPRVWRDGLSGEGVRLAVLDTGIDSTHPDLAAKIVAQRNFSNSTDAVDRAGHGSHVAAIAAGSGAGSDRRRGVAFDAQLLNGKVLGDSGGGLASWVIDGMEWAVDNRADVVNISLGSNSASDGTDPMSQAVNQLSAESDTLFVVASGNTRPWATVNSPGAADAALTVGAVDGRDRLADFSTVGPRAGDGAIKPDITAPGVDIVAARAAGTNLAVPVNGRYVRASGTSMAAPHVAGAAALLAQKRPGWDESRLKTTLIGTADPQSDATAYQEGGGRLNVGRAVRQSLVSNRPSVDFGQVAYPHGVETRTVRVTNTSQRRTSITTSVGLRRPDGTKAPQGMVSVSPDRLRLPPGGSGTITVRLDADRGPVGTYSGHLVADPSSGPALRLPLGAIKQPETHDLRLRVRDREGQPSSSGLVQVLNVGDLEHSPGHGLDEGLIDLDADGEAVVPVRAGRYSVMSLVRTRHDGRPTSYTMAGDPEMTISGDRTVTIDAAAGVPVRTRLEEHSATVLDAVVGQNRTDASGAPDVAGQMEVSLGFVGADNRLFVQPSGPVTTGELETRTSWRLRRDDSPERPHIVNTLRIGSGWSANEHELVTEREIAASPRGDVAYHTLGTGRYWEVSAYFTDLRRSAIQRLVRFDAPVRRTEHFVTSQPVAWRQCLALFHPTGPPASQWCEDATSVHQPGERFSKEWLRGPLLPTLEAARDGDTLALRMHESLDDTAHGQDLTGIGVLDAHYRLERNGDQLAEGVVPNGRFAVHESGRARFRLERTVRFDPEIFGRTTSTSSTWTFTTTGSGAGKDSTPPVLEVDYEADVDLRNRVRAGEPLTLDVSVRHQEGAPQVPLEQVRLWTSTDGGARWSPVALEPLGPGRFQAVADAPAAGTPVSLRLSATDVRGNRVEQEVIDALGVVATP